MAVVNAKAKTIKVRQPVGTNHFQFLAHQPRGGSGGGATEGGGRGGGGVWVGSTTPVGT